MRISDWSSDVCSSDLAELPELNRSLLGDHDADEKAHQPDNSKRVDSDRLELANDGIDAEPPWIAQDGEACDHHMSEKPDERDQRLQRFDGVPPKIGRAHVELQSLMRISYAVFCLKKKSNTHKTE